MTYLSVLSDNQSKDSSFLQEHGLSYYIQTEESKILFDTGMSDRFVKNAGQLNIKLNECNFLVLSHGHYDHTGGVTEFLKLNKQASILLKKECLYPKYKSGKYIGIPGDLELPETRIQFIHGIKEMDHETILIADIEIAYPEDTKYRHFTTTVNSKTTPDLFMDELYLVITGNRGLTLITACSHHGILNIIQSVENKLEQQVVSLVGGLHLSHIPEKQVKNLASRLNKTNLKTLYTGHCTGYNNYKILKACFHGETHYASAGTKIEF